MSGSSPISRVFWEIEIQMGSVNRNDLDISRPVSELMIWSTPWECDDRKFLFMTCLRRTKFLSATHTRACFWISNSFLIGIPNYRPQRIHLLDWVRSCPAKKHHTCRRVQSSHLGIGFIIQVAREASQRHLANAEFQHAFQPDPCR